MDESVLGWKPLAEAWLASRSSQERHVSIKILRSPVQIKLGNLLLRKDEIFVVSYGMFAFAFSWLWLDTCEDNIVSLANR